MSITNLKLILFFVAICTFLFNSCATHSKEVLVYKGKVNLELDDYCIIAGRVIESKTRKPLFGANIIIKGKPLGASTDTSGSYFIEKIVPGVCDIKVSYIGFESFMLPDFNFEKGNYYLVDFELLESEPSFHQD